MGSCCKHAWSPRQQKVQDDDGGEYLCVASNQFGESKTTVLVSIKGLSSHSYARPSVHVESLHTHTHTTISSILKSHITTHTQSHANILSTSTHTHTHTHTDKYAALWPFLGICVEVAVLCAIILVVEKRRSKKEEKVVLVDENEKR